MRKGPLPRLVEVETWKLPTGRALGRAGLTGAARASFSAVVSRCLACLGVAVWAALVS